jgi:hypothetical protein
MRHLPANAADVAQRFVQIVHINANPAQSSFVLQSN